MRGLPARGGRVMEQKAIARIMFCEKKSARGAKKGKSAKKQKPERSCYPEERERKGTSRREVLYRDMQRSMLSMSPKR